MSATTRYKIIAKLEKLREYLGYLRELQKVNRKTFLGDYHHFGLAERYLQLSIEVILDVSKLLIIEKKLPEPHNNREIFVVLGDHRVLSKKTVERLDGMPGFRNILVHEYGDIDREKVYQNLQECLDDFRVFTKDVKRSLR